VEFSDIYACFFCFICGCGCLFGNKRFSEIMEQIFKHFLLKMLIFTTIIIAISFAVFYFLISKYYFPFFPILVGIFVFVSVSIHRFLLKSAYNNPRRFTNSFMLSVMFKLFFYLILSAIYFYINPESAKIFIIFVVTLYVLFSSYEIYLLLQDLKQIDTNQKTIQKTLSDESKN
jgi:hypothetical protein